MIGAALSVLKLIQSRIPPSATPRASSQARVLELSEALGPLGSDFLLLLVDQKLALLDAWRLPRQGRGPQGFPTGLALRLALDSKCSGMLVVQERISDIIPRRPDLELTQKLRSALAETGVELVDHLLISDGSIRACRQK